MKQQTGVLVLDIAITLFSFFVTAPMVLNAISLFTVHRRFSYLMVNEGIAKEEDIKDIRRGKEIAGVIISAICLSISVFAAIRGRAISWVCILIGLLTGGLKYRKNLQYTSMTVDIFRKTYNGMFDKKKMDDFVQREFYEG